MDRRLSLLRVLASFMVVGLHVSGEAYGRWTNDWWAGNVYDSLTRACVPLFFMLTGATLLGRQEPLGEFFRKRLLRVAPPTLFWSAFYLWWLQYNGVKTGNWLLAMLRGPTMFHLWFFYALVGLYAVMPWLRRLYQGSTDQERRWFIGLWFLVGTVLPTAHNLLFDLHCAGYVGLAPLNSVYHLSWFGGYVGYLVLGAYLMDHRPKPRAGLLLFMAASAAIMASNQLLSSHFGKSCDFFLVYLTPFVVVAAAGLFTFVLGQPAGPASPRLAWLADCSLGIYGLHVFIIDPVFKMAHWQVALGNAWWTIPAITAGVFLVSLAVVSIVRLVKPLRYVV